MDVSSKHRGASDVPHDGPTTAHDGSTTIRGSRLFSYSEIGAVSEVLAEPAPCKTPVRSTRIRGAVTRAEGACGELPCPGCIRMGRVELMLGSSPLFE